MAVTRFGELKRVFKSGESELLNSIAGLSVIYEDLRLEMNQLGILEKSGTTVGGPEREYQIIYYLRRSLESLEEFRGKFAVVRKSREYKRAQERLPAVHAKYIADADLFLQQNGHQIKALRNEFAAHVKTGTVDAAVRQFSSEVGKVTWSPSENPWAFEVECDFAGIVLAGIISSKLEMGGELHTELRKALHLLSDGFNHARGAMCALVSAFLWERFGK